MPNLMIDRQQLQNLQRVPESTSPHSAEKLKDCILKSVNPSGEHNHSRYVYFSFAAAPNQNCARMAPQEGDCGAAPLQVPKLTQKDFWDLRIRC